LSALKNRVFRSSLYCSEKTVTKLFDGVCGITNPSAKLFDRVCKTANTSAKLFMFRKEHDIFYAAVFENIYVAAKRFGTV
jgi:hypothetical protein